MSFFCGHRSRSVKRMNDFQMLFDRGEFPAGPARPLLQVPLVITSMKFIYFEPGTIGEIDIAHRVKTLFGSKLPVEPEHVETLMVAVREAGMIGILVRM